MPPALLTILARAARQHGYATVLAALNLALAGCSSAPSRYAFDNIDHTQITTLAEAQLGRPYRYGGSSPAEGFDCSGLVYFVHAQGGTSVPRTAGEQYQYTTPLRRQELRPGDLVFFRRGRAIVSHVGIYLGEGRFIHAPGNGKQVSIDNLDEPYWRKHYIRGGRFTQGT